MTEKPIFWRATSFRKMFIPKKVHGKQDGITAQENLLRFMDKLEEWQIQYAKIVPKPAFVWRKKTGDSHFYTVDEEWVLFYPTNTSREEEYQALREFETTPVQDDAPERPPSMDEANEAIQDHRKKREEETETK